MDYIQRFEECPEEDKLLIANIFLQRAAYRCDIWRIKSEKLIRLALDERRPLDLKHMVSYNHFSAAKKDLTNLAVNMPGVSKNTYLSVGYSLLAENIEQRAKEYLVRMPKPQDPNQGIP